ncbi:sugar phosphate nucleotidyltransferase [Enterococcus casseliflavus]|uniref:sugar phosphate nucleotidyltransferase n=1 Tax=Enterococcus casseliflavus TaxID=37734 RepID=UPI003D1504F7
MKLILLSGGSGKRLWPLSNDQQSKQFLKLLRKSNGLESMVQRVWSQLEELDLTKDTLIATGESQRNILKNQLNVMDDKIITEPNRRDTFPAIALASAYLYSELGVSEDEVIIVLPVDPYVDKDFFNKLNDLKNLVLQEETKLGLIGINPTLPSEKYGYIIPHENIMNEVSHFIEKPNEHLAKKLIEKGAVWNAGVFAFQLSTIKDNLEKRNFSFEYSRMIEDYDELPRKSFDYEFTEKQNSIKFLKYNGFWKDLGTWNTLSEEMDTHKVGDLIETIDCLNTHVINDTRKPISVIGVKDLIVAAGSEGILVSTKKDSPRIKELPEHIFKSINYYENDWGKTSILFESNNSKIILFEIFDSKSFKLVLSEDNKLVRFSGVGNIEEINQDAVIHGIDNFKVILIHKTNQ